MVFQSIVFHEIGPVSASSAIGAAWLIEATKAIVTANKASFAENNMVDMR